ncbi:Mitochondrial outer membrane protein porin 2 [Bienertia sinuspersici]
MEVQYFHHHAIVTSAVTLNKNPIVDLTATLGTPAIALYAAGVNVSKPESCGLIGDKGDTIKAWCLHHLDQLKKSGCNC